MTKIKLVLNNSEWNSFRSTYLQSIFVQYFDFLEYDPSKKYTDEIFVTKSLNRDRWYAPYTSNGSKLIVDNLWEHGSFVDGTIQTFENTAFILDNENWFWYNESLWYRSLGYNLYKPELNFQKKAFMPINMKRPWRSNLIDKLGARLENFIWSYGDDVKLIGDLDRTEILWQRYFNPIWYNSTEFSLVVESTIENVSFITEKSFKPISYRHPFLIYGPMHTLAHLRNNGFETFGEMFDESYDECADPNERLNIILQNIDDYSGRTYITNQKIEHNCSLFYNEQLVKNRIVEEIIFPLLEYAES